MTTGQEEHLSHIKQSFMELVDTKYRKGAAEHGGFLWARGSTYLLDCAIEEAIDQVVYLLTLRESLERCDSSLSSTSSVG